MPGLSSEVSSLRHDVAADVLGHHQGAIPALGALGLDGFPGGEVLDVGAEQRAQALV